MNSPISRLVIAWIVLLILTLLLPALARLAHAGLVLENGLTEERTVQPGAVYQGSIPLRNTGSRPLEVKIYQTDYRFSADGRNEFGPPGHLPRSNAGWIKLDQAQVIIPPGEQLSIGYSLAIPNDTGLIGSYWSVVMIEPLGAGSPESLAPAPDQIRAQLSQVIRHGIQLVTHIADTGRRELQFDALDIGHRNGQRVMTVDVSNTGERWLRPNLTVELYTSQGLPAGRLEGSQLRVFPDTSVRYRIPLEGVAPGHYLAMILADGGGDDLFGTQVELDLSR